MRLTGLDETTHLKRDNELRALNKILLGEHIHVNAEKDSEERLSPQEIEESLMARITELEIELDQKSMDQTELSNVYE